MKIFNFFHKPPAHPADINHDRYQAWLKDFKPKYTARRPTLQRIYVDRFNNNWYLHKDGREMSEERAAALDMAAQRAEYNLEKSEHDNRLDGFAVIAQSINDADGNTEKISKLTRKIINDVNDMKYRMSEMPRKDMLIELALVLFCIDDENPHFVNVETQNRKRDLVAKDDALRSFFLQTSFDTLKRTTASGGRGFLRYLDQSNRNRHSNRNRAIFKTRTNKPPASE